MYKIETILSLHVLFKEFLQAESFSHLQLYMDTHCPWSISNNCMELEKTVH